MQTIMLILTMLQVTLNLMVTLVRCSFYLIKWIFFV